MLDVSFSVFTAADGWLIERVSLQPQVSIGRTREGKPYLANSPLPADVAALPNWNFNVTHHGGIVAIATEPSGASANSCELHARPLGRLCWLMVVVIQFSMTSFVFLPAPHQALPRFALA